MRRILTGRSGVAIFSAIAIMMATVVSVLDFIPGMGLGRYPVTSNMIAAIGFIPLNVLIVSVILGKVLETRERKRFAPVTAALTDSINRTWSDYRRLIRQRYCGDHTQNAAKLIQAARLTWSKMDIRETEADRDGYELEAQDYGSPADWENELFAVQGIWMQMWGAGVEVREQALSRRLTRTLLPRLLPSDPEITVAVRTLNDAIEDLNDRRADLNLWEDPFPSHPYVDEPGPAKEPEIANGIASVACDALDELANLLSQAHHVLDAGDRLVSLLPQPSR